MFRYLSFIPLLILLYSCTSTPHVNQNAEIENTNEIIIQKSTVYQGLNEFNHLMKNYSESVNTGERDIDNREWIMGQVNFWADKDQLALQRIYEDLQYRDWEDAEKREYLSSVIPLLREEREYMLEELAYLIEHSMLFHDMPWMVRDFYDERTEFSYWYILYLGRSMYPFWLDDTVLPEMLNLIPQDRITAVTYLWMKNPENLLKMKSEIYNAGYPWSRLIYLIEISDKIRKDIKSVMSSDENKKFIPTGSLF